MKIANDRSEPELDRERPWDREAVLRLLDDIAVHLLHPRRDRVVSIHLELVGFYSLGKRDFARIEVWIQEREGGGAAVAGALAQEAEDLFIRHERGSRLHHDSSRDQNVVAQSRVIRRAEVSAHLALETARRLGAR